MNDCECLATYHLLASWIQNPWIFQVFPLAFKTTSSLRHRPLHSGRICSCCGHPNPWHPMATFKNWRRQKNGQSCAKKGLPVSAHCSSVAFQAQSPAPPVFFGSWCTKPAAKKWSNMLGFSLKEVGNFYQSRSSLFFWKQKNLPVGSLSSRLAVDAAVAELSS